MEGRWVEEELVARARELEEAFLKAHNALMAIKRGEGHQLRSPFARWLMVKHLEAKQDNIIDELDEMITNLTVRQPTNTIAGPRRLKLVTEGWSLSVPKSSS